MHRETCMSHEIYASCDMTRKYIYIYIYIYIIYIYIYIYTCLMSHIYVSCQVYMRHEVIILLAE